MATTASTPTIGATIAAIGIGCEFEEVRVVALGGGEVEALKGAVGTLAAFRASEVL
jgi:hypothetical protein